MKSIHIRINPITEFTLILWKFWWIEDLHLKLRKGNAEYELIIKINWLILVNLKILIIVKKKNDKNEKLKQYLEIFVRQFILLFFFVRLQSVQFTWWRENCDILFYFWEYLKRLHNIVVVSKKGPFQDPTKCPLTTSRVGLQTLDLSHHAQFPKFWVQI